LVSSWVLVGSVSVGKVVPIRGKVYLDGKPIRKILFINSYGGGQGTSQKERRGSSKSGIYTPRRRDRSKQGEFPCRNICKRGGQKGSVLERPEGPTLRGRGIQRMDRGQV